MPDLRVVDAGNDRAHWDRYVASDPLSTFCHQAAWRGIMTGVLGHECLYLAAVDESGVWRGVLPLVRVRSVLRAFFELGASSFGTSMIFGAVYNATGAPVAGACCFHWRDELEVMWASSLREYNRQSPNMLL